MNRRYDIGHWLGLHIWIRLSVLPGLLGVMLLVIIIAGNLLPQIDVLSLIVAGFLCAIIHFMHEFWHNYGHSLAARRTGYPMQGIDFFWIIGASVYPQEPTLPASVHIQRALGGPLLSLILSVGWLLLTLITTESGEIIRIVVVFGLLDSFFFYTVGALIPLKLGRFENDGTTILRARRQP